MIRNSKQAPPPRNLFRLAVLAGVATAVLLLAGLAQATARSAESNITLVTSVRDVANPYHAVWVEGSKAYAKHIGAKLTVLQSGNDSQKQLTDLQSFLASHSGKIVVLVDPNTDAIAEALVRTVERRPDTWIVTAASGHGGIRPGGAYPHWIAHYTFDGVPVGDETSKLLFKAMGNKGGVIALLGIPDVIPGQQRFAGLKKALKSTPGVKLLAAQVANFDQTQAFQATQSLLSKYGDKVTGIWAANDGMALGALAAVKAVGRHIPITGTADSADQALQSMKAGTGIVADYSLDAYYDGSEGLAMGVCAATGRFDPTSIPHVKRTFYTKQFLITPANVNKFLTAEPRVPGQNYLRDWNCKHLWDRYSAPAP